MTRVAWFHCFAGTAGDMTLGALVHAGADPIAVAEILGALPVDGYALSFEAVQRCGIASTHAIVAVDDGRHDDEHGHVHAHRPYRDIRSMLETAQLPSRVRERAQRTFRLLADVEGRMHRMDADDVELHEVGALDAIVDIVGSCAALEVLGVERIVCSPITVGQGSVKAAHGELPNPAPAVAELLALRQVPSRGIADRREIATPTGVALMVALADEFGPLPAMNVTAVGYGAGTREIEGRPNVVQVVLGETAGAPDDGPGQPVELLECNVDDVTGEVIAHTIAALLRVGAHDAWATPIVMKKGRPAHTVHALADPAAAAAVRATMLAETGSLGVRGTSLTRWPQRRDDSTVEVGGHQIRVKVSGQRVKVEHDDAVAAAEALGLPLRIVLERAAAGVPTQAT
jgi:uncharacterized protein (TIGR00299 family) protein